MSIQLEGLSYWYTRRGTGPAALADVGLEVPNGTLTCLLGATGSGKSTLMKCACGLLRPDRGRALVDGEPVLRRRWPLGRLRRDPGLFGRIGYVMQRPERQLFAETVLDDVAFGPGNLGLCAQDAREAAERALARLGIAGLAGRSPFSLSGGQQRLAAIAGVLAMGPANLAMDEPMGSLDPAGRHIVRQAVLGLRAQGVTVLMVTHDMGDAAELADSVAVLDAGRLVARGTPAEVFSHSAELRRLGLGMPDALAFAHELEAQAPGLALGSPLSLEALADGIAAQLGEKGRAPEAVAGAPSPKGADRACAACRPAAPGSGPGAPGEKGDAR